MFKRETCEGKKKSLMDTKRMEEIQWKKDNQSTKNNNKENKPSNPISCHTHGTANTDCSDFSTVCKGAQMS